MKKILLNIIFLFFFHSNTFAINEYQYPKKNLSIIHFWNIAEVMREDIVVQELIYQCAQ